MLSHYGLTWSSVSEILVGFRTVPALGPVDWMIGDSVPSLANDWSAGVLLELKRIRPNALNYEPLLPDASEYLPRSAKWYINQLDMARNLLGRATRDELRRLVIVLPDFYKGATSVADVEKGAEAQCGEYLERSGPGTVGFTVVQVGWTLLVKAVSAAGSQMRKPPWADKH